MAVAMLLLILWTGDWHPVGEIDPDESYYYIGLGSTTEF